MLQLPGVVSKSLAFIEGSPDVNDSPPLCHLNVDYRLVRHLGRGSGGSVKLVWREEQTSCSLMAMKVISKWTLQLHSNDSFICAERDFLSRYCYDPVITTESHVIRFRECHQTHSHIYIFYDYCIGGDLFDFISHIQTQIHPSFILECTRQLVIAVNYIHSCGFIHADIRLENILIDKNGILRIADFGSCYEFSKSQNPNFISDWTNIARVMFELSTSTRSVSDRSSSSSSGSSSLCWPEDKASSSEWNEVIYLHHQLRQYTDKSFTSLIKAQSDISLLHHFKTSLLYLRCESEDSGSGESRASSSLAVEPTTTTTAPNDHSRRRLSCFSFDADYFN